MLLSTCYDKLIKILQLLLHVAMNIYENISTSCTTLSHIFLYIEYSIYQVLILFLPVQMPTASIQQ